MFESQAFSNDIFVGRIVSEKTEATVFEIQVSKMSQMALNNGLVDTASLSTLYVEVDSCEPLKGETIRRLKDLLLRKTLLSEFPWNSMVYDLEVNHAITLQEVQRNMAYDNVRHTAPHQQHAKKKADVASMKGRYGGRVMFDRSVILGDN